MKPPPRKKMDYEKVVVGEMIPGKIEVVEYDQEHKFRGFQGKEDTTQPAVRLKFKLDGYKYPHYTRWMKFSLGEKANLYKKYVSKLVADAVPDMDIDLDILNGLPIKTVWGENGDFQNIDAIYPAGLKVKADALVEHKAEETETDDPGPEPDDTPF